MGAPRGLLDCRSRQNLHASFQRSLAIVSKPTTLVMVMALSKLTSGVHSAQETCTQRPSPVGLKAPPAFGHNTQGCAIGGNRTRVQ